MDRTAPEPPAESTDEPPQAAPVAADAGSGAAPVAVPHPLPPAAAPNAGSQTEPGRAPQTTPAYSVQVGAFLHLENAEQMVHDLSAKGYSAGIFAAADAKGRYWHTVRIGDFPSRKEAQQRAEEFSRRESAKCVIRPYGTL
jgi:cell division septation protein DedD